MRPQSAPRRPRDAAASEKPHANRRRGGVLDYRHAAHATKNPTSSPTVVNQTILKDRVGVTDVLESKSGNRTTEAGPLGVGGDISSVFSALDVNLDEIAKEVHGTSVDASFSDKVVDVNRRVVLTAGDNVVTTTLTEDGSPISTTGSLKEYFSDAARSPEEVEAQKMAAAKGIEGDQGGHLIGHRFILDQGPVNLFPQEANFNMSAFKTLENDYARAIDQGYRVECEHKLGGFDKNGRPDSVSVSYKIVDQNGAIVDAWKGEFMNRPGQAYERRI